VLLGTRAPLVLPRSAAQGLVHFALVGVEVVHLLALTVVVVLPQAQCDLALFAVHFDDLGFELVANLEPTLQPAGSVHSRLADVDESLHAAVQLHEDAAVGQLRDFASRGVAALVLLGNLALPGDGRELLVYRRIRFEHLRCELRALGDYHARVPDLVRAAHLRDVDRAYHSLVLLDEGAVRGPAKHGALDPGAERMVGRRTDPGDRALLLVTE